MYYINQIFNNREIALFVWIVLIIGGVLLIKGVRKSLPNLLKTLFCKPIMLSILAMLTYITLIILVLYLIRFWDISLLKDTVYWLFGGAFVMLFHANKVYKEDNYFKNIVIDNLKLILVLEFILNLYAYSLVIELILVPIIIIVVILSAFSEGKEEYKPAKKFFDYLLMIILVSYLIYSVNIILSDFNGFASISNLKGFLLPPILTITLFPFTYFIALYMLYETFFVRIKFGTYGNKKIEKYARKKVFLLCWFNLKKLNTITTELNWFKAKDKDEVKALLKKYK